MVIWSQMSANTNVFMYSPYHKTLLKSGSQMHSTLVKFYEMGAMTISFIGIVDKIYFHKFCISISRHPKIRLIRSPPLQNSAKMCFTFLWLPISISHFCAFLNVTPRKIENSANFSPNWKIFNSCFRIYL